jgi:hypothetical protein
MTFNEGYDRGVIVKSARHSPDGQAVYLGDLIAWPWRDPGLAFDAKEHDVSSIHYHLSELRHGQSGNDAD